MSARELEQLKNKVHISSGDSPLSTSEKRDPERYKAQKIADVVEAMQDGKLPTTGQTVAAIEKIEEEGVIPELTHGLSPAGRKIGLDVERTLETSKDVLVDKNRGELVQQLVWYSSRAAEELGAHASDASLSPESQRLLKELRVKSQASISRLSSLVQLVGTSSEFRRLLNDLSNILQSSVENKVNQSPEARQALDRAKLAKDQSNQAYNERPSTAQIMSAKIEPSKDIAHDVMHNQKSVRDAAKDHVDLAADVINAKVPEPLQENVKQLAGQAANATGTYVQELRQGQSAVEVAKHVTKDVKAEIGGFELEPEKRDHIIHRFQDTMYAIQNKPEFQQGLNDLMELIEELVETANDAAVKVKETSSEAYSRVEGELKECRKCAKQLIENFAGHKSLDPLINSLTALRKDMMNDTEFNMYLQNLKRFLAMPVREPRRFENSDVQDEYQRTGNDLINRGRQLVLEKYSDQMEHIADEAADFVDALRNDAISKEFANDIEAIVSDLALDASGRPTLKLDLVQDLTRVIPRIASKLEYLPLPRVESDDADYHVILDNIVVKCSNIVPKYLRIYTDMIADATRQKDQVTQVVKVTMSKVQASARDITFYYNKKKGLIAPADVGLLDFDINGSHGVTVNVCLQPHISATPGESVFDIRTIEVNIEDFSMRLHKTHHDFMYKLLSPWIKSSVRKNMEEQIGNSIRAMLLQLNASLAESARNMAKSAGLKTTSHKAIKTGGPLPDWSSPAYNVEE